MTKKLNWTPEYDSAADAWFIRSDEWLRVGIMKRP